MPTACVKSPLSTMPSIGARSVERSSCCTASSCWLCACSSLARAIMIGAASSLDSASRYCLSSCAVSAAHLSRSSASSRVSRLISTWPALTALARAHLHRTDETIDRRRDHLLHRAFDARRCDDAVRARQQRQHGDAEQADRRPAPGRRKTAAPPKGRRAARPQRLRDAVADAVIGALLQRQQRAGEHRRVLGGFERRRVEAAAALEQQRTEHLVARRHRHGVDRGMAVGLREFLVRQRDRRRGARRQRVHDRQALVERLGHRRADAADGVVLLAHVGGAGDGGDAQAPADVQAEADALAGQHQRQLVDDRRGRGVEVRLRQRMRLHRQHRRAARRPHGARRRTRGRLVAAGSALCWLRHGHRGRCHGHWAVFGSSESCTRTNPIWLVAIGIRPRRRQSPGTSACLPR